MSRFDRYILSQLLTLFGFFALVLVAVYWVNRAVSLFDRLIGDGQSALVFLELTALTLPNVMRLVLPVAAFAAAAYVTNRLTTESELVVMQATGFSAFRLARPVLVYGLIVAGMMAVLMHVLVPASRTALNQRQADIAQDMTARFLQEGVFQFPADGVGFYIRKIDETGELRDIFLSDGRDAGSRVTYTARSALLMRTDSGPRLLLFDGMAQRLTLADRRLSVTRFADFSYDIGALLAPGTLSRRDEASLPTRLLLSPTPEVLTETGRPRAVLLYEGHNRLAQPFLATVAGLIGFATLLLGAFSRFGLWRQLLGATLLLVLLQFTANAAENLGIRDERLWPLAWAAPLLGAAVVVVLLALAQRPRGPRWWRAGRAVAPEAAA
ncbi:LPS export ABC transporter permease LptF [Ruixingdingia sedimenti]|uniref:LPS export ABC transporter permease LptF n=1 Tax=Ruixingdingia sedimenti TaxID=3073604 RepID=A0ABU1F7X0_9RHOB|nr:LPS export ABC transporter permease LptF [Xinfangfangia sp. LG-4]MDR5652969.1 LPS export ABC transporter permease LptF [Xinfangfangia sp. LG-4]